MEEESNTQRLEEKQTAFPLQQQENRLNIMPNIVYIESLEGAMAPMGPQVDLTPTTIKYYLTKRDLS